MWFSICWIALRSFSRRTPHEKGELLMEKLKSFRITALHMEGFKSYSQPTDLSFGDPTVITGGNGRGKSSIADAIAFAVTGLPFFGEHRIDRLHNEDNPCLLYTSGSLSFRCSSSSL